MRARSSIHILCTGRVLFDIHHITATAHVHVDQDFSLVELRASEPARIMYVLLFAIDVHKLCSAAVYVIAHFIYRYTYKSATLRNGARETRSTCGVYPFKKLYSAIAGESRKISSALRWLRNLCMHVDYLGNFCRTENSYDWKYDGFIIYLMCFLIYELRKRFIVVFIEWRYSCACATAKLWKLCVRYI